MFYSTVSSVRSNTVVPLTLLYEYGKLAKDFHGHPPKRFKAERIVANY